MIVPLSGSFEFRSGLSDGKVERLVEYRLDASAPHLFSSSSATSHGSLHIPFSKGPFGILFDEHSALHKGFF